MTHPRDQRSVDDSAIVVLIGLWKTPLRSGAMYDKLPRGALERVSATRLDHPKSLSLTRQDGSRSTTNMFLNYLSQP